MESEGEAPPSYISLLLQRAYAEIAVMVERDLLPPFKLAVAAGQRVPNEYDW